MGQINNTVFLFLFAILTTWFCTRPEKTTPDKTTLPGSGLSEKAPSLTRAKQDGLDYLPLQTGHYEQLPAALTKILNWKYAGWALPQISENQLQQVKRNAYGPYYLQEDLNGDKITDYVVQFLLKDTITLAAYLMRPEKEPLEYILEKYPVTPNTPEIIIGKDSIGKPIKLPGQTTTIRLNQPVIVANSATGNRRYVFKDNKLVVLK